jgi:serine/threonine protein kinase
MWLDGVDEHFWRVMQVFRAYDIESGTEVALKIHCLDNKVPQGGGQKEYVRRAIREVNILEPLRHQCIVRLHHVFEITDTSFAIVMEACKGSRHFQSFAI